jgi:esterase/lipase
MTRLKKVTLALSLLAAVAWTFGQTNSAAAQQTVKVYHKTVKVGDLDIFYREAGPKDAPTILLLHGFPTSSQMFRNLIPVLGDQYHVVAPDYPGVIDDFTEKIGVG